MKLWIDRSLPSSGWHLEAIDIHPQRNGRCEVCGRRRIKCIRIMTHDSFAGSIAAGKVCASRMRSSTHVSRERTTGLEHDNRN